MDVLQPEDPQRLGEYRLLGRLGAGGMGRVYLARSLGGRTVAVKVVRPELAEDPDFRRRFRHEVDNARAVSGHCTAPVVDADTETAVPWLATAYILGPSLAEVVEQHGALPERTVRALGAGLATALGEIHSAGLVHRDLKPSNVLMAADGPRVIDFGIARAVEGDRMTQTGVVVGSPGYMSPEQAMGLEVGAPGDVFSLGTVLAFAATGRSTFGNGAAAAMLYKVVHEEPDLADMPDSLVGTARSCLAKDPADRPLPATVVSELGGFDNAFTDWLPGAVSSTIATHASRILDLDTPSDGSSPVTGDDRTVALRASGPVRPNPATGPGAPTGTAPAPSPTPSQSPTPAPSRRRFLGIAAGAVGVTAVGGGAAWVLAGSGGPGGTESVDKGAAGPEAFTTPPNGTAPEPLWHEKVTSGIEDLRPSVVRERMLIAGGPLRAYELTEGDLKWRKENLKSQGAAGKLVSSSTTVFFGSGDHDGELVGIDPRTKKEVWRARLSGKVTAKTPIGVDEHHLYVTATADTEDKGEKNVVAAIDLGTRKEVWHKPRVEGADNSAIEMTVARDHVVYTDGPRHVTVRQSSNGRLMWSRELRREDDAARRVVVHKGIVILGGDTLRGHGLQTGSRRWSLPPDGRRGFLSPALLDGVVYVFDLDRGVWAVDPMKGDKHWSRTDFKGRSSADQWVKVGSTVYAASVLGRGGIYAIDSRNGDPRWIFNDGVEDDARWHVAASGKRLLVAHGHNLYALPAV